MISAGCSNLRNDLFFLRNDLLFLGNLREKKSEVPGRTF
jgi:hypothetical protein